MLKCPKSGKFSLQRVLLFETTNAAILVAFAGLVGWFFNKPDAVLVIGCCSAILTAAPFAKALQKKYE